MRVTNIHKRQISQPIAELAMVFNTLSTDNDMILATDKWSPMKLDKGLQVGSKGGHGPMKYFVTEYQPEKSIIKSNVNTRVKHDSLNLKLNYGNE